MCSTFKGLVRKGVEAQDAEDHAAAIRYFAEALEVQPGNAITWNSMGSSQWSLGDHNAALCCFRRALELTTEAEVTAASYCAMGACLLDLHRDAEAEKALLRSIEMWPSGGPAGAVIVLLGVVQGRLGMLDKAEQQYRHVLSLYPDNEEAMFNLAMALPEAKNPERVALLRRALEIDPDYSIARRELRNLVPDMD